LGLIMELGVRGNVSCGVRGWVGEDKFKVTGWDG